MNTDNQPNADDGYRKAWQQAFDNADETPPLRVWNAIEQQLDAHSRARVIPLWGQVRPWATGVAAAVTLVLTGWWAWQTVLPMAPMNRQSADQVSNASAIDAPRGTAATRPIPQTMPAEAGVDYTLPIRQRPKQANARTALALQQPVQRAEKLAPNRVAGVSDEPIDVLWPSQGMVANNAAGLARRPPNNPVIIQTGNDPFAGSSVYNTALLTTSEPTGEADRLAMSIDALSGKSFQNRKLAIQRVVWFRQEAVAVEVTESVESRSIKRQKWVSASLMPASFNPAIGVKNGLPTLANASFTTNANLVATKTTSLRSEPGRAIAVLISAGTQLNKRWSVEAGVGYLQAQSTVMSPTQVTQGAMGGTAQTLYTAMVLQAIDRGSLGINSSSQDKSYSQNAVYDVAHESPTRNDYRFIQVPVQVGYQLRPRRKMGLALLGGVITNLFVRNSVGEAVEIKPEDQVYKGVTLAATAGARLRYRSSARWSASMAGMYQQSLQIGTQADTGLDTHPHAVGVSVGMDYHF